jgi:hypothetical protein
VSELVARTRIPAAEAAPRAPARRAAAGAAEETLNARSAVAAQALHSKMLSSRPAGPRPRPSDNRLPDALETDAMNAARGSRAAGPALPVQRKLIIGDTAYGADDAPDGQAQADPEAERDRRGAAVEEAFQDFVRDHRRTIVNLSAGGAFKAAENGFRRLIASAGEYEFTDIDGLLAAAQSVADENADMPAAGQEAETVGPFPGAQMAWMQNRQVLYFQENVNLTEAGSVPVASARAYAGGGGTRAEGRPTITVRYRKGNPQVTIPYQTSDFKYYVKLANFGWDQQASKPVSEEIAVDKAVAVRKADARGRSSKNPFIFWLVAPPPDSVSSFTIPPHLIEQNYSPVRPGSWFPASALHGDGSIDYRPEPDWVTKDRFGEHPATDYGLWLPKAAPSVADDEANAARRWIRKEPKKQSSISRPSDPKRAPNPYAGPATDAGADLDRDEQAQFRTTAFEWCHLIGHGDGGREEFANFVVGTEAVNTEQLALEGALRPYRGQLASIGWAIRLDVEAALRMRIGQAQYDPEDPHANVADSIQYSISFTYTGREASRFSSTADRLVLSRKMSARRRAIFLQEVVVIEKMVRDRISAQLAPLQEQYRASAGAAAAGDAASSNGAAMDEATSSPSQ